MATKKKSAQSRPLISKSPNFRTIYVTGAVGSVSPFDYRLAFYNHESIFPETPTETQGVAVSQVFQVELAMSYDLMKRLKELLVQQIEKMESDARKAKGDVSVKTS